MEKDKSCSLQFTGSFHSQCFSPLQNTKPYKTGSSLTFPGQPFFPKVREQAVLLFLEEFRKPSLAKPPS